MATIPDDTYTPTVQPAHNGRFILMLTADDVQDLEFFYPYYRFIEEGFQADVVTPKGGEFKGKQGMGLKHTKAIADIDPITYELLYIPGGKAPAHLKKEDAAVALVREFAHTGKPISAICHGPQMLAAADVIQGKRIAAWPEVEDEVTDAGAIYLDQPVVTDGQFITARWPADLPVHVAETLRVLRESATQNKPFSMAAGVR